MKPKYCIYDDNPVTRFLYMGSLRETALKLSIILLGTTILILVACWHDNILRFQGSTYGVLKDPVIYLKLIIVLVVMTLAKPFFNKIPETFLGSENGLDKTKGLPQVIDFKDDYEPIFKKEAADLFNFIAGNKYKLGIYIIYFILISLMFMAYVYYPIIKGVSKVWAGQPKLFPYAYASQVFQDSIIYLILVPPVILRIINTMFASNMFLRKLNLEGRLILNPLSPDGSVA